MTKSIQITTVIHPLTIYPDVTIIKFTAIQNVG